MQKDIFCNMVTENICFEIAPLLNEGAREMSRFSLITAFFFIIAFSHSIY